MEKLINGNKLSAVVLTQTGALVIDLKARGITPCLGVVLVGNDKPSHRYVEKKRQAAEACGICFELITLPATENTNTIEQVVIQAQQKKIHGLIVQLPLPKTIDTARILQSIQPEKDVDCLTTKNQQALATGTSPFLPPTVASILYILEHTHTNLQQSRIAIIGNGMLVGKPLAQVLTHKGVHFTISDTKTNDVAEQCKKADIIVTGVGKKDLIRGNMVQQGAIVIDAGVAFENGKMYGDVCMEEVAPKASYITPTPGGVGPLTVAFLLANTVQAAKQKL